MKIIVLMGSPNRKGSTSILAEEFKRGAEEAGHNVVLIDVCHADVNPCIGCTVCGFEGPCVQKDGTETIRAEILSADMVVFRPLIGMDKQEIIDISYKIDTFETSIEPYEDCCTVFTPKHPRTKPVLKFVKQAQENAGFEPLIEEALQNLKITYIS